MRGISLNHNVGGCRTVALHGGGCGELLAETLGNRAGVPGLHLRVQLRGHFEKLSVAGFPYLEKRTGVQTAFHRTSLVEALFERLADQVLLQTLTAGVLQYAGQPLEFLTVEAVQRIGGVGHGTLEI
jgi:hypothetical protein